MKKTLIIIALAAISFGFIQDTLPDKKLKVELTIQEWQGVLNTIEQSSAPHTQVKAVQEALIKQLQPQIKQDTTKK